MSVIRRPYGANGSTRTESANGRPTPLFGTPTAQTSRADARAGSQSASSYGDASDARLVAATSRGEVAALGELYDRFGKMSYGLALHVVRDERLAEDVVQDAFVSLWRTSPRFDPGRGSVRVWIATLTKRRAIDAVRRSEHHRRFPTEGVDELYAPSAAETSAQSAEGERVRDALASLPFEQREALALAYYGGFSQSEIARGLSVPLGTVKSRVFHGLSRLRTLLGDG